MDTGQVHRACAMKPLLSSTMPQPMPYLAQVTVNDVLIYDSKQQRAKRPAHGIDPQGHSGLLTCIKQSCLAVAADSLQQATAGYSLQHQPTLRAWLSSCKCSVCLFVAACSFRMLSRLPSLAASSSSCLWMMACFRRAFSLDIRRSFCMAAPC